MSLSSREQQIVDLVRQGYLNINIAAKLGLAERTVKNHLNRIYLKLQITGARPRQQLIERLQTKVMAASTY